MQNFSSVPIAIAIVAAFLLAVGGVRIVFERQTRGRGILMILAAAVIVMNVMIWTV